ncbi:MAG: hypothetical protein JO152_05030 [Mycobacteriaceae bacterium]|nr:hypothetical protein [Mycobacteriaceae bacterium]
MTARITAGDHTPRTGVVVRGCNTPRRRLCDVQATVGQQIVILHRLENTMATIDIGP